MPEGGHHFGQFGQESLAVDGGLVLVDLDGYEPGWVGQVLGNVEADDSGHGAACGDKPGEHGANGFDLGWVHCNRNAIDDHADAFLVVCGARSLWLG